jgi:hypothetical protein
MAAPGPDTAISLASISCGGTEWPASPGPPPSWPATPWPAPPWPAPLWAASVWAASVWPASVWAAPLWAAPVWAAPVWRGTVLIAVPRMIRIGAPDNPGLRAPNLISHCDGPARLLEGAARVFVQSWMSVMPRAVRGAHVVREGALSHGRTKEKDLPVPRRHAPQPSGPAARGARRMRQLRRAEAAPSRMQPLRPLRRPRGGRCWQAAAGRCPGLRPGRGVSPGLPGLVQP